MDQKRTPDSESARAPERLRQIRKPYAPPALTEYGSVAKLTQGTLTTQSDGKTGGFKMGCL